MNISAPSFAVLTASLTAQTVFGQAADRKNHVVYLSRDAAVVVDDALRSNVDAFNESQARWGSHKFYRAAVTADWVRFPVFAKLLGNQDLDSGLQKPSTIECLILGSSVTCAILDRGETGVRQVAGKSRIDDRRVAKFIYEAIPGAPLVVKEGPFGVERKTIGNLTCEFTGGYAEEYRCLVSSNHSGRFRTRPRSSAT